MEKNLRKYLIQESILSIRQFGFMAAFSCTSVLMVVVDGILIVYDNKEAKLFSQILVTLKIILFICTFTTGTIRPVNLKNLRLEF